MSIASQTFYTYIQQHVVLHAMIYTVHVHFVYIINIWIRTIGNYIG